jgi:hypothetical protein
MLEPMYPVEGGAYGGQAPAGDMEVPEAPSETVEVPVDDEMSRILNMLAPPEEAPQEQAPPEEEGSGMDDVFAKLRAISDEFEAQPAAPQPPAPVHRPAAAQPPARAVGPAVPPRKPAAAPAPAPKAAAAPRPAAPAPKAAAAPRPAPPQYMPPRPNAPKAAAAAVAPPAAQASVRKRLMRCPKCQVVFEVQDTGQRPLPIKCTACGTTGSLKK